MSGPQPEPSADKTALSSGDHSALSGVGTTVLTGAEIVWATLEGESVREVFGYPGGAILPIYDALDRKSVV